MNYGRMSTHERTDYTILYKGEPVVFPAKLQTNTGYSNLWKVYILEGAPQPALIAGSQSMYLITEEEGQAKLTPLDEQSSGFAGLQWLDSDAGQPALNQEVYMSDDGDTSLVLSGGDYLLVSYRKVLYVPNLTIYPLYEKHWIDGYHMISTKGAVAFSPDRKQVAFPASKNDDNNYLKYNYAMIVFDYTTGEGYLVPFSQTDTRMRDIHVIDHDWINTFFEWQKDATGNDRLHLRSLEKLPYWHGWFADEDTYYHVQPVSEDLLPAFADFVLKRWNLSQGAIQAETVYEFKYLHIQHGEMKFTVGYREKEQDLTFSKHLYEPASETYRSMVIEIGKAFEAELAKGHYQEYFTSY